MQVTQLYVWVTLINCSIFSWIGSRISCCCSKITYWHGSWAISTMIRLLLIRIIQPFDFNMIAFTSIEHYVSTTRATTCAVYKRPWTLTQSTATSWSSQTKNQEWMLTHIGMCASLEFSMSMFFTLGPTCQHHQMNLGRWMSYGFIGLVMIPTTVETLLTHAPDNP